MIVNENIPYVENGDNKHLLNEYLPEDDDYRIIIFFHGGSLVRGSREEGTKLISLLEHKCAIISVEYPYLTESDYQGIIEDAAKAVAYVQKRFENKGKIFIAGSSAGAYITMMLLMNSQYLSDVGVKLDDISGFISDSAQTFAHFNILKFRGFDSRLERIDETAPIFYLNEQSCLRPLLLMFYSNDMVCRKEENLLFATSLKRFFPEAKLIVEEIEGKHCHPKNEQLYLDKILDFVDQIRNKNNS